MSEQVVPQIDQLILVGQRCDELIAHAGRTVDDLLTELVGLASQISDVIFQLVAQGLLLANGHLFLLRLG
ncbi:hypothetical protein [Aeromicrobium sp. UC242_57]|uniref:hypothetical protein n=1 Tax=Aeromicrobium sp. UC242_57 TaxID=3374624 RepID=UPI00379AA9DE